MYYLQSRYYDPSIGRFISADQFASTGQGFLGYNMFAYCGNNPVNMADSSGTVPFFVITCAVGAVLGAAAGGIYASQNGGNVWAGIGAGASIGALAGLGFGAVTSAALAGSITATSSAVMAGGAQLASTAVAGGVSAGAAYVSSNLVQATTYSNPVLYSGGDAALSAARQYASTNGGTMISDTIIGRFANTLAGVFPSSENFIWTKASELFCQCSSGIATAFVSVGSYSPDTCIFWNNEVPALLNNWKIAEIVSIYFN